MRLIASLRSLALAIWACGSTPLVSHLSASQLILSITSGSVTIDHVVASCGATAAPPCGDVSSGQPHVTGAVVSGGDGVFQLMGDFASVGATYAESVAAPITWAS